MEILYLDEHLLFCVKPAGLISQETSFGGEGSVPDALRQTLRETGERYTVFPVHRLDKETGGVMVFARDSKTAARLSEAFSRSNDKDCVYKHYLAVVHGRPDPAEGELSDWLFYDRRQNKVFVVDRKRQGVKEARLAYRTLATINRPDPVSLLDIQLFTGRTHQIRVQFASRQMPLVGDRRYGAREGGVMGLWSWKMDIVINGRTEYRAEKWPGGEPWDWFSAEQMLQDTRSED